MDEASEVISRCQKAVEVDPNNGDAWYNLGIAYLE
jgi:Flp pilus assembly protein TadD